MTTSRKITITDEMYVTIGQSQTMTIPIRIRFTYHPAQRAYTPRGEYAPVDPPEPALAEDIEITAYGKAFDDSIIINRDWAILHDYLIERAQEDENDE